MLLASPRLRRSYRLPTAAAAVLALLLGSFLAGAVPAQAVSSGLVLSRVYGGGGNAGATFTNDYIEIFNRGATTVSLDGLSLQYASATGTGAFGVNTTARTELPAATVPPGGYFLVQEAAGTTPSGTFTADFVDTDGPINMGGTAGKVAIVTGTTSLGCNGGSTPCDAAATGRIIDLIGFGNANYFEGSAAAPTLTNSTDARRKGNGCVDTDQNAADFEAVTPAPRNSSTAANPCGVVGDNAPTVTSTSPADGATNVAVASPVTINFSEPVDVLGDWFSISCVTSGAHSAAASSADGTSYTLDPATDFAENENCTVTVLAANVTDQDSVDPPDNMAGDVSFTFSTVESNPCLSPFTSIHDIQGSGTSSSASGQTRTTEGVVTGDFQGGSGMNGVFIQEPDADADPLTSEGVFVFIPAVSPFASLALEEGDTVHLRGRVTEFQNQTEIDNLDQLVVCGTGATIAATAVTLPETTNGDLERYEGMKVTIPQTLTVEQNFFQGRYGQLTLGSGGRLYQPTNKFPAGSPQALALAAANDRALIVLDDAFSGQNRDPVSFMGADNIRRAGDSVSGIAGILDEGAINSNTTIRDYRVQVTQEPTFSQDNKRTAAPEEVGGNLEVASFNVLNYFTTLTSEDSNARGADTAEERERQGKKIWSAMQAIDADVFGLMEIENRPNANAAAAFVGGLNQYIVDHGGPANSYTAIPNPATGTGTDFIKVALIYKSSKVTPSGPSLSDPNPINDRPTLAQTFQLNANGEKVSVLVNHFKSKGSCPTGTGPDADQGDGQGCWNAKRVLQAQRLLTFIDTVTTAAGDEDALVIGDLNSYGKEDPILALEAGGLVNQLSRFVGPDAYSYVFDGLSGYLDHGLATPSASSQVVGATEWHINADESSIIDYNTNFKSAGQIESLYSPDPYRSSDHDPVVLGLELGGCSFTDNAATTVRTLDGDCSTSTTVGVPDGWTLDGAGHSITAYDASGDHFRGAVVANEGAVANVRNLTVTAMNLADVCDAGDDRLRGILLDGAAGTITDNTVVGIKQGTGSGCQEGTGIEARNAPFTSEPKGPKGPVDVNVTISGNTVTDYQKAGIVANGSVHAQITGNTVTGAGPVGYIAQNGVQIGFGGTGDVTGNRISDNFYTGPDDACGVLFYDADKAKEKANTFSGNEVNVCKVKAPKPPKEPKPAHL